MSYITVTLHINSNNIVFCGLMVHLRLRITMKYVSIDDCHINMLNLSTYTLQRKGNKTKQNVKQRRYT